MKEPQIDIDAMRLASAARDAAMDKRDNIACMPTGTLNSLLDNIDMLLTYIRWLSGTANKENENASNQPSAVPGNQHGQAGIQQAQRSDPI